MASYSSEIQRLNDIISEGKILNSELKGVKKPYGKLRSFFIRLICLLPRVKIAQTTPKNVAKAFSVFQEKYIESLKHLGNQAAFKRLIDVQVKNHANALKANPQKKLAIRKPFNELMKKLPPIMISHPQSSFN